MHSLSESEENFWLHKKNRPGNARRFEQNSQIKLHQQQHHPPSPQPTNKADGS